MEIKELPGFLLIDKPAGISSFDVIRKLRKQTGIRTFGHAGTLDPFATGLMVIAINKFTRLLPLLDNADKEYAATLMLGTATTTGDPEGEITEVSDAGINPDKLASLQAEVLKIKKLKPPLHSAIKVDGKRAYDRARADEDFDLPERDSTVHDFDILFYEHPLLSYRCRVSKGTYIRSLSIWIARYLGTVGYATTLRRLAIGRINLEKAVALDEISADNIAEKIVSVTVLFPDMENVMLSDAEIAVIRNGNCIQNMGTDNEQLLVFNNNSQCLGIAGRKANRLCPKVNL
jgi:tRNA pseudouridine55 synthase